MQFSVRSPGISQGGVDRIPQVIDDEENTAFGSEPLLGLAGLNLPVYTNSQIKGGRVASVRYLVNDVETSIKFYSESLGFQVKQQFGPAMAILEKGDLTLWLAGPASSAAKPMPDGSTPSPGGWNRFVFEVKDIHGLVLKLKTDGVRFRNEIIQGPGGVQVLCEDPPGNVIELFQPL